MITQLQQLCNAYGEASTFILKLVSRIRSIVSSHALGFGFGITTSKYPIIELSEVVEVLLLHRPNHLGCTNWCFLHGPMPLLEKCNLATEIRD